MNRETLNSETRVTRRKRETRARIFQKAIALFVEKGLDQTTVAEIADAADIGKGTFFTYFPSKESVFAEVSVMLIEQMEEGLDEANAAGSPLDIRVAAFFRPAIDWHAANPVLSRCMLAAFMRDEAFMRADRASQLRLYERLARELAGAQASGEITRDVDCGDAITAITGTYFGNLGAWHAAGTATPLAADFARSLAIVLRGLRP